VDACQSSNSARGGLVRTFGGLATFLVLTFLCGGIYLLEDAVANPLAAHAAALIFGAFITALATILLFYLIRPENGAPTSRPLQSRHGEIAADKRFARGNCRDRARGPSREDLVYQRVYRDRSRIRL